MNILRMTSYTYSVVDLKIKGQDDSEDIIIKTTGGPLPKWIITQSDLYKLVKNDGYSDRQIHEAEEVGYSLSEYKNRKVLIYMGVGPDVTKDDIWTLLNDGSVLDDDDTYLTDAYPKFKHYKFVAILY